MARDPSQLVNFHASDVWKQRLVGEAICKRVLKCVPLNQNSRELKESYIDISKTFKNVIVKYKVRNVYICTNNNKMHFLSLSLRSSNSRYVENVIQKPQRNVRRDNCMRAFGKILFQINAGSFQEHDNERKISQSQNDWQSLFFREV